MHAPETLIQQIHHGKSHYGNHDQVEAILVEQGDRLIHGTGHLVFAFVRVQHF